jgi:hypothetical protein
MDETTASAMKLKMKKSNKAIIVNEYIHILLLLNLYIMSESVSKSGLYSHTNLLSKFLTLVQAAQQS